MSAANDPTIVEQVEPLLSAEELSERVPVTDISMLANCNDLKWLDIRALKITPADVDTLQKALRNCAIALVMDPS